MTGTATNYHHRCGHPLLMEMDTLNGWPLWFDRATLEDGNHRVTECPKSNCQTLLPPTEESLERAIARGDIAADKGQVMAHDHKGDTGKALVDHRVVLIDFAQHPSIVVDCGWSYNPIGNTWDSKGVWEDPQKTAKVLFGRLAFANANSDSLTARVKALLHALDSIPSQEVAE